LGVEQHERRTGRGGELFHVLGVFGIALLVEHQHPR
jgi:hypothetical protein